MKRTAAFILTLALLFSLPATSVLADASFYWGNNGNTVSYSGRFGLSGDSSEGTVFFVSSFGNAKIKLEQQKGTCQLLSYTKPITGIQGKANEWGKYEVIVSYGGSSQTSHYYWDSTYNNDSITLEFNNNGQYYVYVRPYTSSEMTDSYLLDMFVRWDTPATWWIDSQQNCNVSTSSPYKKQEPAKQETKYYDVKIRHYVYGRGDMNTQYIQMKEGWQTIKPRWSDSNYKLDGDSSQTIYVSSGNNEVCFYYNEVKKPSSGNTTGGNNTNGTNSGNNNRPYSDYNPDAPFLYGIEEYSYCKAPEYRVDPTEKPWNYCYLYDRASDINGRNMGRYDKEEVVKVIKYHGGNHGKFNYCYVITQDNQLGYMHDYALQPVENSQQYYENTILGW